jgi:hypothetical protein
VAALPVQSEQKSWRGLYLHLGVGRLRVHSAGEQECGKYAECSLHGDFLSSSVCRKDLLHPLQKHFGRKRL